MKVKELATTLKRKKFNVAAMHSDLEQAQREEVMLNFKNNKVKILVATDIVARGIDIEDIGLVLNYDVPHDPEDYIHRIGRTARAAATGSAVKRHRQTSAAASVRFHLIRKKIISLKAPPARARARRRGFDRPRSGLPTRTALAILPETGPAVKFARLLPAPEQNGLYVFLKL